jgi:plasmid stabilization system protein ParE
MAQKKKAAQHTYQVKISQNALQNIDEITGFIAFIKQQPHNAIKVGDALFRTIENIGKPHWLIKSVKKFQPN